MVVFIGAACSSEQIKLYSEKYKMPRVIFVQQRWDYKFHKAMEVQCENYTCLSYPPIMTFPTATCFIYRKNSVKRIDEGIRILPMVNLPVIKQLCLIRAVKSELEKICKEHKGEEVTVLTNCIYPQSLIACRTLKERYGIKVYSLIPDLPDFISSNASGASRLLNALLKPFRSISIKAKKYVDGYICFTEEQMNYLDKSKPHIVMEGFSDMDFVDGIAPAMLDTDKMIFVYGGGLRQAYGVNMLVDAFDAAKLENAELWLYGNGDSVSYIKEKGNPNIVHKGNVPHEEMIAIEKAAFMLVNPRFTHEAYSKCSFPSKLLEYMSTGTPVLTTRLEGIGEEYFDKMLYFEDVTVDGMKKTLTDAASKDDYSEMTNKTVEYVRKYKNVKSQAKKVLEFISSPHKKCINEVFMNSEKHNKPNLSSVSYYSERNRDV